MQLKAFALAVLVPLVSAKYPITADDVKCRAGPKTSAKIVKTYAKDTDVTLTCQTYGESISGNAIWDKTKDDCYVADYYVKTGSDGMVVDNCAGDPEDDSKYNGDITRKQIVARANVWIQEHVPYSMDDTHPDIQGREYRTDCSGFVSMAFHTKSPGYSTLDLADVGEKIDYDEIQQGDMVGTLAEGTGGASGHVVLFDSWTDDSKKEYNTIECKGTDGCVMWTREVGWAVGSVEAEPYRYIRVTD